MKRLVLALTVAAVAATVAPAANAMTCPTGFYSRGTGVRSPLSGQEIRHCWPSPPPAP